MFACDLRLSAGRFGTIWLAALLLTTAASAEQTAAGDGDEDGIHVNVINSPYQDGETKIRVLLPDDFRPETRYHCLYVLPVEANGENHYGDGLLECRRVNIANRFQLICVAPTFSQLPWYADHPFDLRIRQETYMTGSVVPWMDEHFPVIRQPSGRLLVGFSKSGWGAFSLLLRHPELFSRAAAWDAPLMMQHPDKYGMQPIFGSQANFQQYQISRLLRETKADWKDYARLVHLGYGNFREHHQQAETLMNKLGIRHTYRDGPPRIHDWHSGWLVEAVELLVSPDPAAERPERKKPAPGSSPDR